MKASYKAIKLIKDFEGFRAYPYICPAGKRSIGYGHVIDRKYWDIINKTTPITQEDAENVLKKDVSVVEGAINSSVIVPLTQGQFDALASLIFNWGVFNFKASKGFGALNKGRYRNASFEFFDEEKGVVRVSGKILPGLVKRRQAELELWNAKA